MKGETQIVKRKSEMENTPHIFISYSSKDRSLVEKIHLTLEAAGVKVGAIKRAWKLIRA